MTTIALPNHYKEAYRCLIKYACGMILFALLSGILFQESGKKVPYEEFGPGMHWESVYHLALLHGHSFLIGTLIPTALIVLLHVSLVLGAEPIGEKCLKWGKMLYLAGATLSIALMLYKGYHFMLSVRGGETDFAVIEASLFGGISGLRHGLYGLTHTAMAVGLGMLAWKISGSLPKLESN